MSSCTCGHSGCMRCSLPGTLCLELPDLAAQLLSLGLRLLQPACRQAVTWHADLQAERCLTGAAVLPQHLHVHAVIMRCADLDLSSVFDRGDITSTGLPSFFSVR